MSISRRDADHIFQSLRGGVVPDRGLDAFAVGIERQRDEVKRILELAEKGEGVFKFLRGGYGCGKSFMSRLAVLDAQRMGFATSFVVVSDNDLQFHRFDDVYRKVVAELGTSNCPRGAIGDILDRWIARVEGELIATGADENADDFDAKVEVQIADRIRALTRQAAPEDFARAVQAIFRAKQAGNLVEAGALLSWLGGSGNVAAGAKAAAGLKGDLESRDAMQFLQGIVELVKAAGYKGLLIVIDEAETILRMRKDVRGKSLNGVRQICDAAKDFHGLVWLFTGTPEFFDTTRGVAGLQPLHDRIKFSEIESPEGRKFASLKQPQLNLSPFDADRLQKVALKLQALYPAADRGRLERLVTPRFIEQLVEQVTKGFAGDVGVVPRQFLRKLADIFDLVEQESDFDPSKALGFEPKALTPQEERLRKRQPPYDAEPDDAAGYKAEVAF